MLRIISILLILCATLKMYAQNDSITLPDNKQKSFPLRVKSIADSVIDSHTKITTDTVYVSRPEQRLTLRLKNDIFGNIFSINGTSDQTPFKAELNADIKSTFGIIANYRGLSISLSFNPSKIFKKTSNTEYNINYYNNKYGADLTYSDIHDFQATFKLGEETTTFNMKDTRLWGVSANIYYVFNNKRYSYPAAFSHSWVQKRSAGSFLVGASLYRAHLTSSLSIPVEYLSDYRSIYMAHVCIGIGYGYNYVVDKHWLLHISSQPYVSIWKDYTLKLLKDENSGEADDKQIQGNFPQVNLIGRISATYNWSKYFIGVGGVVQTFQIGQDSDFTLQNTIWKGRAYFGFRL
ncbi:MAG: DUF4421 domain-containing protein [Bacteroidaceae bacterium]|nr:DUF4421 domain-containing protein [Bacteroidaceae bacterium]